MLLIPLNDVVTSTNWCLTWTVNQLISLKISYPDENQNQFGCTVPNIFFIAPAQSYDENSRTPPEPNKENRPIFMRTVPWQYLLNFKVSKNEFLVRTYFCYIVSFKKPIFRFAILWFMKFFRHSSLIAIFLN